MDDLQVGFAWRQAFDLKFAVFVANADKRMVLNNQQSFHPAVTAAGNGHRTWLRLFNLQLLLTAGRNLLIDAGLFMKPKLAL